MSEENVEIVRAAFEPFSRGEFSALADLPDNLELILAPEMPDAGTYRDAEARQWMLSWAESFERLTQELVELRDVGDGRVLAEFIQRGWSAGSDVPVELPTWSLITLRDGEPTRMELFMNRDAALEAAGVSE
jgi:ketosteroid isomerase-like protein